MSEPTRTIGDLLPAQDSYYVLHDGKRYAKHGNEEANGLLVFNNRERAEQFCMTVGKGLPAFRPLRIDAEKFLELIDEMGAICIAEGLRVTVATITGGLDMRATRDE